MYANYENRYATLSKPMLLIIYLKIYFHIFLTSAKFFVRTTLMQ